MTAKHLKIILRDLDLTKIHANYDIECPDYTVPDINGNRLDPIGSTSDISSLHEVSYIHEQNKQLTKCHLSTINLSFEEGCNNTDNIFKYNCFWCRHPFVNEPVGCPIKCESNKILKTYKSAINNQSYNLIDEVPKSKINTDDKSIYTTDGIFCSFNCCVAYIEDNKNNNLYDKSYMLLLKLYRDMTGFNASKISPAPDWRLIDRYGGHLNINEFRSELDTVKYIRKGMIRHGPRFNPVSWIYDRKLQL